jgi:hypothetical protein
MSLNSRLGRAVRTSFYFADIYISVQALQKPLILSTVRMIDLQNKCNFMQIKERLCNVLENVIILIA